MNLAKLLDELDVIQIIGSAEQKEIESITLDSREVTEKSIFVAIKGFVADGHSFIPEALSKKAAAIILDNASAVPAQLIEKNNCVRILVKDSRIALAQVSDLFFEKPSKKMKVIGITGTKGKTTTAFYIKNILEKSGSKVGLIGTMKNMIADKEIPTSLTTPEANTINYLMNDMVTAGCKYCVMEVSSHSLELHRVDFLDFDVAVFTNLTSDHMDFHKNRENYLNAKKILFDNLKSSGKVVYNLDDSASADILNDTSASKFSFGKDTNADIVLDNIIFNFDRTDFSIVSCNKNYNCSTKLVGGFNAYNAIAAFSTAIQLGICVDIAIKGIESLPQIAGRFEVIKADGKIIIIDFSHTADSLRQALVAVNEIAAKYTPKKKIYTVFGCGGDRDKTKRPLMGKYATELSKKVFVTSDNPRNEDPFLIIKDIESGIALDNYEVVEDRELAIKRAITESERNSLILIAGKGHENYQLVKGVKTHFSDKEVAQKYLSLTVENRRVCKKSI